MEYEESIAVESEGVTQRTQLGAGRQRLKHGDWDVNADNARQGLVVLYVVQEKEVIELIFH